MSSHGNSSPRTVLFVETDDWAFAKHRIALASRARAAGYKVVVAAPRGEWADRIVAQGFEFHTIPLHRSSTNPFRELVALMSLVRTFRRVRPDIAHHIAFKSIIYGSLAARLTRVKGKVNYVTGLGYLFTGNDLRRRFIRLVVTPLLAFAFRGRNVVNVFENSDDLDRLAGSRVVGRARSIVGRGSGVDTDRFVPSHEPDGAPVVLLASRLLLDKGVVEFVDAVRELKDDGVDLEAVIAGSPDPENPSSVTEEMLKGWQSEGVIRWTGYVEDMPAAYAAANIVCLPSYREGLPVSLLEAAASGRPVVTTDVPGCRDVVVDGVTGLLVPARDAKLLASALRSLVQDPELRRQMGAAGRDRIEDSFSNKVAFDLIIDIYRHVSLEAGDGARPTMESLRAEGHRGVSKNMQEESI